MIELVNFNYEEITDTFFSLDPRLEIKSHGNKTEFFIKFKGFPSVKINDFSNGDTSSSDTTLSLLKSIDEDIVDVFENYNIIERAFNTLNRSSMYFWSKIRND